MASYTKNYLYIYSTQAASMLLGLLSLFIIIPFLSSNKEIYGIYAICSSLTIFYNYADIGFLGAGQKFASEAFIRKDYKQELSILGFSGLVFFLFLLLLSIIILYTALNPSVLIPDISSDNVSIATSLLIILAFSSPIVCFQRICQMLFSIRLSDYYFQLLQLLGSIIKISLVFVFFGGGNYDIVGYYFAYQLTSAFIVFLAYCFLYTRFGISFWSVLRNFRFTGTVYLQLKDLAFASLFGTVCWVLYYELDNVFISRLLGAQAVAVYAVAFSVLTIFRNIFGTFFSPYPTRFNYFVGLGDISGLNSFAKTIMEFFLPICLIPIIVLAIVSQPFIFSWVGIEYEESVSVLVFLLFCNILAFVSYPSGLYITAVQENKHLYFINGIIAFVFLLGVFTTYRQLGVLSFAMMKALGMILSAVYGVVVVFRLMHESIMKFIRNLFIVYSIPILFSIFISLLIRPFMMTTKGTYELLMNISIIICLGFVCFCVVLMFSSLHRDKIQQVFFTILSRIRDER